ncbi:MAG: D-alanyl-D-alanine carboxypeptidase family protein [Actinomycetota bacterium]
MTPPMPGVGAASWIIYDETNDWVIAARQPDAQRAPASTTKMMTALVVADLAAFDEKVTITTAATEAGEAEIGLVAGEVLTVGDLVAAMLVRSANDAAMALAEHVGDTAEGFAGLMNAKSDDLGLTSSHFANPHGLDEGGHYTSAADELIMARALLDNPQLAAMARSPQLEFPPAPDGTLRGGSATNLLLGRYGGAIGVKTGYTVDAALVLVAAAERDGRRLIAVVMGAEQPDGHFLAATSLLNYGFDRARVPALVDRPDPASPLAAVARIEAMAWLADAGLLAAPTSPIPPFAILVRGTDDVPGWQDALGWVTRYWDWLAGDL